MTITNDFFNSSAFEAYKVPAAIHFEYANHDGAIKTLESQDDGINYIAGSAIVTGPKGEQYPISAEKFADLYDDNKDGTATPKMMVLGVFTFFIIAAAAMSELHSGCN